jgi:hypothetical protein
LEYKGRISSISGKDLFSALMLCVIESQIGTSRQPFTGRAMVQASRRAYIDSHRHIEMSE